MKRIKLTQGKFARVDDDLFDELNQFNWYAMRDCKTFYAIRAIPAATGQRKLKMHNEVFRLKGKIVPERVDHRDRDGLNNRWSNLRPATHAQQMQNRGRQARNTGGYTGVTRDGEKWKAFSGIGSKDKNLGRYTDPFSAAWVRDEFVREHHGEFGVTNNLKDRRRKSKKPIIERRSA